ncbi:MAG: MBL fold metallo-hydrolase [Chloroflexi bacterium]|nr:MBL fold metallo-hydrolase [Chloroflexota bacterium]
MKITFHGAAGTTTGSMHMIETDNERILLDCGLYQGHRAEAFERNSNFPFDPKTLSAVILSHAHIDHSGNLPSLVKHGYAGKINCTSATRDLVTLMLRDSARIQEQDAEYLNQKKSRKGLPPIEPLYSVQDAERTLPRLVGYGYNEWYRVNDNARAMMVDAGHILGSAITTLEINENGRTIRLGFTGDLGRPDTSLLCDPDIAHALDYLIIESTYGNREHGMLKDAQDELAQIVHETVTRGGKVIIPSFAIGRTQEIVYTLHLRTEAGELPRIPIYVDSPLAIDATDVFRLHVESLCEDVRDHLMDHDDPFGFHGLHYTRSVEESKRINTLPEPCIIISASGMCEAGRILHHLKNNLEDKRNTILFVGYQAENTLGRRIVDGARKVRVFGDEFTVNARIAMANGFSAHADHSELIDWVNKVKDGLKGVFVVHGESESSQAFAAELRTMGNFNVTVPTLNQTIQV